jgi:hypothetical protein
LERLAGNRDACVMQAEICRGLRHPRAIMP